MKALAGVGFSRVKAALREAIARNAGISILRVDNIFVGFLKLLPYSLFFFKNCIVFFCV